MIFKNIFLEYFLNLLSKCLTAFASVYYFSKNSRILAIVYHLAYRITNDFSTYLRYIRFGRHYLEL